MNEIKIYNQDTLEYMKGMKDKSVDMILTDPPYLYSYKTNFRKKTHDFSNPIINDNNPMLVENYIKECYRIMKDNTAMLMFCNFQTVDFFLTQIKQTGFNVKNVIIWEKNNWTAGDLEASLANKYEMIILANKGRKKINGKRIPDIIKCDRVVGKKQIHQNQKPTDLLETLIEKFSNEGDIIFDGFMGSGSTYIASINQNRKCIGCELDEKKYQDAINRIQTYKENLSIL
jgi:site-specific DNA-methyltransferase (adenine-specific)